MPADPSAASARRNTKRFEHRPEVVGCFALERHVLAGSRMHESENPRMEHRPRRSDLSARVIADIHAFADQGMAELGHVDANLMLPPGFEAALDQGRTRERSDRRDLRDRTPRLGRNRPPGRPKMAINC